MIISHADSVFRVEPGTSPNYNEGNSLVHLMEIIERTRLAAEREVYLADQLQYLFPIRKLELYGVPSKPPRG